MSIAIFSLIGGTFGDINDYIGCTNNFKGAVTYWEGLDELFVLVDKTLCSDTCKCTLTEYSKALFQNSPMLKHNFNEYFVYDIVKPNDINDKKDVINFQNCPDKVKETISNEFKRIIKEKLNSSIKKFNIDKFAKYWNYIERKFSCSGFCATSYQDKTQRTIMKYLFSDVNKAVPFYKGCLYLLIQWLQKMLIAYGCLGFISACIQVATFVSGIYLLVTDPSAGIKGQQYEDNQETNVMSNHALKS